MRTLDILLVENEEVDVKLIRKTLSKETDPFFKIDHCPDLSSAIDRISKNPYSCVLLDLNLPDSSGIDTLRHLISHNKAVPIIVLTNLNHQSLGIESINCGAQDYLIKGSINTEILVRVINYSIERIGILKKLYDYHKTLETMVNDRTIELKNLYLHLEDVREEERTAIARDIHDDLGQMLTAIKMDLSWIGKHSDNKEAVTKKLTDVSDLVDKTIKSIRRICSDLRPGLLDDLGLVAAMEWQTEAFSQRTGLICSITIDPPDLNVSDKLGTALFRIFQECLTNIVRHAQATKISILLTHKNNKLILEVKDNGKGIKQDNLSQHNSFGIKGIKERAKSYLGEVSIDGKENQGTTVKLIFPLDQESKYD